MSTDDPDFWSDVQAVFAAAMEIVPSERDSLLRERCANRPELRAEVESLLASHDGDDSFLSVPAVEPGWKVGGDFAGTTVGPFRLVERIGAGGMGIVYLADRAHGEFAQRVAVKLLDGPVRNAGALRRFRAERQILAALSHPHIVTLLDGGVTEDGQPYLAMEYVEGLPITTYCRERALSIENRLRLFQRVCAAVQYAHQHGVVHSDLKPGNILVTSDGIPKILDFGVAKLFDPSGKAPDATATGQLRPLTPNYASPEHLRGLAVTTASDIYALGVLMYELLTEARPYDAAGKPLDEILRIVVEEEPPRPSAAIGALDAGARSDRRRLRGDLDSIVLKAMSKEAGRRYASAQELSEDITRHLTGRPVVAREPSLGYVVRRLAARHKAAFLSASVSLVVIVAALFLAIRQAQVATVERDRARIEAAKARQVSAFLRTLFSAAYPRNQVGGAKPSVQDLLDRGAARVDQELGGQPDVQASMLALFSSVYTEMGLYRQALPLGERSLALREQLFGPEHLDVAESLFTLGRMKRLQSEHEAAQPLLERAVKIRERHGGPEDPLLAEALNELGSVLWLLGRYDEARAHLERAVAIEEKAGGPQLARWLTNLSNLDYAVGDFDSAQRLLERALEIGIRTEGRAGYLVSVTILNLGSLMREQEDYPRAQVLLEQALEIAEQLYGTEHQALVFNWGELGELYLAMGDHARAREFLTRSITVGERILGREHLGLARPLTYSGRLLLAEGRPREALPLFERALRMREKAAALDRDVAENLVEIAGVKQSLGDSGEAERLLRRALAMQRDALVPGHRALVPTLTALGELIAARNREAEALPLLEESVQIAREKLPTHHSQRAHAEAALALHARR